MKDDIDRRFDIIGELDYVPRPLDPTRRRRTIADCRRENAYFERHGIQVFRRPEPQEPDDSTIAPPGDPCLP